MQFDGAVSGAGELQKDGAGALNLTGNSTYTGATTVSGGTLAVNGSIASSVLTTINAGATLGGNGTVGNTVINAGGALAPGNSVGTLTVQGSLILQAAASYLVEVSAGTADRTNVIGTATLGGATVNAIFGPGSFVSKKYTILNATGGLGNSTFGAVNSNQPAFQASLSYDANNVYLNVVLGLPTLAGLSTNQQNIANTLSNAFNSSGGIPVVFGALTPEWSDAGLGRSRHRHATDHVRRDEPVHGGDDRPLRCRPWRWGGAGRRGRDAVCGIRR